MNNKTPKSSRKKKDKVKKSPRGAGTVTDFLSPAASCAQTGATSTSVTATDAATHRTMDNMTTDADAIVAVKKPKTKRDKKSLAVLSPADKDLSGMGI